MRTKTLVKNSIIVVDAAPFRSWYEKHYGQKIGVKGQEPETVDESSASAKVQRKHESRRKSQKLDSHLNDQFAAGRILACISSRPGQSGRCDGYILEGKELEFYQRKLASKKHKK